VESQLSHQGRKDDAQIFAAHASMMRDPTLLECIERAIFQERLSAEAAVARAFSLTATRAPSLRPTLFRASG
jgi:phosphoenolpyruvate-protein kinase (PTS system EI component)